MTIDVFDQTGKKLEAITLNKAIFGAPVNAALIAQAIRVRLINARTGTAHTKTRDEVRGGGRKPWRQKGTGRARHGSIRSPLWVGGGTTHGPRYHKPQVSMPTTMRRAALFSALTDKLQSKGIVVVNKLTLKQFKTKEISAIFAALPLDRSILVVLPQKDQNLQRAMANLPNVKIVTANVLHPYEILKYKTVVLLQDALPVIEETFLNKTTAPKAKDADQDAEVKPKAPAKATAKKATSTTKKAK